MDGTEVTMDSNTENTPKGTGGSEPIVPPRKASSVTKWQVITVVLILAVAALAVAYVLKSPSTSTSTSTSTPGTGPLPTISGNSLTATVGQSYGFNASVVSNFESATFYFGDGQSTTYNSSSVNSGTLQVTHTYEMPGSFYIYFTVKYSNGSSADNSGSLIPVIAAKTTSTTGQATALLSLNASVSSAVAVSGNNIFASGSHFSYYIGYTDINGSGYSVISQTVQSHVVLQSNEFDGAVNIAYPYYNVTSATPGLYQVLINTTSATGNSSVGYSNLTSTITGFDVAVFTNAGLISKSSTTHVFTNDEVVAGGYKTLDGAIAYDTVSNEILGNVYQYLVQYNGSSNSTFFPELAAYLPSVTNGGISSNYQNYTFTIRANASWQDGTPVTAYDVYYSFVRTLLFDAGSPGTGGWIIAQVMLPGNIYTSNTYTNITNNLTFDNATNTITFHFQGSESPTYVFQLLSASGDYIMSSKWLIQHGAGITFTPAGFIAYQKQGIEQYYNTYVEFNAFANGPYEISYNAPNQEVIFTANPAFQSPGPWYPKPQETTVNIKYVATPDTAVLDLESGQAQTAAGIPTTDWSTVQAMQSKNIINIYHLPTLDIYWFNLNANINTKMLASLYPGSNVPQSFFTSLAVRNVFAYTFAYNYYINYLVGNAIYNTIFAESYAGMLPAGMAYAQTISDLNSTTTGVPYFDLTMAKHYWNQFLNSSANKVMGVTASGDYNGSLLNIPILIFNPDPVDQLAVQNWAYNLSEVIFGTTSDNGNFPVHPINFNTELGYMQQGLNPMPVYELGWAPDYPNPTDYLGPMAAPTNTSTYPGPNDFNPYWFNGNASNPTPNATEAAVMKQMLTEYANGTNTSRSLAQQEFAFHQMNQNLINMTFYVYLYQAYGFQLVNSHVPSTVVYKYMENVMISAMGWLYNYFYTT